nr:MAG TPA: hypothetical protein [Caudoviricetes sp.]
MKSAAPRCNTERPERQNKNDVVIVPQKGWKSNHESRRNDQRRIKSCVVSSAASLVRR